MDVLRSHMNELGHNDPIEVIKDIFASILADIRKDLQNGVPVQPKITAEMMTKLLHKVCADHSEGVQPEHVAAVLWDAVADKCGLQNEKARRNGGKVFAWLMKVLARSAGKSAHDVGE